MYLRMIAGVLLLIGALADPARSQQIAPRVMVPQSSIARSQDVGLRAHTNIRVLQLPNLRAAPPALLGAQPHLPPVPGENYETPRLPGLHLRAGEAHLRVQPAGTG